MKCSIKFGLDRLNVHYKRSYNKKEELGVGGLRGVTIPNLP